MNKLTAEKIERIIELKKNRDKVQEQVDSLNKLIKEESVVVLNDLEYLDKSILFKSKNKYYFIQTYDQKEIDLLTLKEKFVSKLKIEEIKLYKNS